MCTEYTKYSLCLSVSFLLTLSYTRTRSHVSRPNRNYLLYLESSARMMERMRVPILSTDCCISANQNSADVDPSWYTLSADRRTFSFYRGEDPDIPQFQKQDALSTIMKQNVRLSSSFPVLLSIDYKLKHKYQNFYAVCHSLCCFFFLSERNKNMLASCFKVVASYGVNKKKDNQS